MAKKWKVEGRIRVDYLFEEIVEASTEKAAVKKAESKVYKHLNVTVNDVIDDEIYCEPIKEWGSK